MAAVRSVHADDWQLYGPFSNGMPEYTNEFNLDFRKYQHVSQPSSGAQKESGAGGVIGAIVIYMLETLLHGPRPKRGCDQIHEGQLYHVSGFLDDPIPEQVSG